LVVAGIVFSFPSGRAGAALVAQEAKTEVEIKIVMTTRKRAWSRSFPAVCMGFIVCWIPPSGNRKRL